MQSVDDWRGALWEGRGGAIGHAAAGLFRPGAGRAGAARGPAAWAPRRAPLRSSRCASSTGSCASWCRAAQGGDFAVGFKLGPGAIPAQPTADALRSREPTPPRWQRGELDPLEAFMAGRIRVDGDMTLVMQMQAIQMQAAHGGEEGVAAARLRRASRSAEPVHQRDAERARRSTATTSTWRLEQRRHRFPPIRFRATSASAAAARGRAP